MALAHVGAVVRAALHSRVPLDSYTSLRRALWATVSVQTDDVPTQEATWQANQLLSRPPRHNPMHRHIVLTQIVQAAKNCATCRKQSVSISRFQTNTSRLRSGTAKREGKDSQNECAVLPPQGRQQGRAADEKRRSRGDEACTLSFFGHKSGFGTKLGSRGTQSQVGCGWLRRTEPFQSID